MAETTGHEYLKRHEISGDALQLDIQAEASAIREVAHAAGTGHAAKTLVKDGPLRIVIVGLSAGASVREHEVEGPAVIHVLSGKLKVVSGNRTDLLSEGNALVLASSMPHSLEAESAAVALVTIAWPAV